MECQEHLTNKRQSTTAADHEQAKAGGPPFIEAAAPYPDMLRDAGWDIVNEVDLTSTRRHVAGQEAYTREIANVFGEDEASGMLTRRRATVRALESGCLRRVLFEAVPSKSSS